VRPTIQQERDFLFQAYFGGGRRNLELFVSRAYRDMNRTFRGVANVPEKHRSEILEGAKQAVIKSCNELQSRVVQSDIAQRRATFDEWHSQSCKALIKHYHDKLDGYPDIHLTYGQAQKWVNMALKYCWVCGNGGFPLLDSWLMVAHVPVDNLILDKAVRERAVAERPLGVWSQWTQDKYLKFQREIREFAEKQAMFPLELEFDWWLEMAKTNA
jgi:hypothetical protein